MQLNLDAKQTSLLPLFWACFAPVVPMYGLLLLYGVVSCVVSKGCLAPVTDWLVERGTFEGNRKHKGQVCIWLNTDTNCLSSSSDYDAPLADVVLLACTCS